MLSDFAHILDKTSKILTLRQVNKYYEKQAIIFNRRKVFEYAISLDLEEYLHLASGNPLALYEMRCECDFIWIQARREQKLLPDRLFVFIFLLIDSNNRKNPNDTKYQGNQPRGPNLTAIECNIDICIGVGAHHGSVDVNRQKPKRYSSKSKHQMLL